MERLLVTGIDHPLGCNLALQLADRCEVFGLHSQQAMESSCFHTARWEPGNQAALKDFVHEWQPQWIMHCGPLSCSSWDWAAANSPADEEPQVVVQWAKLASEVAARLTVISSDVVFAGPRMFHEEASTSTSPLPRATQVRATERALEPTGALVVRTHAYGWSPVPAHAGFAERAFESLNSGARWIADGRRHATPILATDLAELLFRAYETRLHGLYHLAGAERSSPSGFVSELAMAMGFRAPSIGRDMPPLSATQWQDETSLNSKRARRALEMSTPMLREGLDRFAEQAHNGWRDRCRAMGQISSTHEFAA
ncbi:MAG: sugar nucleotide-binding protein [Planctomycetia bacterium]|nr:sugar nucleotide-binding protein [Planctomycetia bacterium]